MIIGTPPKKRGIAKGVKNALKHADSRHSETQQVTYTTAEWHGVQSDMEAAGISTHTRYARRAVVNYREMQKVIAAAKELVNMAGTGMADIIEFEALSTIITTYQDTPC